jgi:hypothetical protein
MVKVVVFVNNSKLEMRQMSIGKTNGLSVRCIIKYWYVQWNNIKQWKWIKYCYIPQHKQMSQTHTK